MAINEKKLKEFLKLLESNIEAVKEALENHSHSEDGEFKMTSTYIPCEYDSIYKESKYDVYDMIFETEDKDIVDCEILDEVKK